MSLKRLLSSKLAVALLVVLLAFLGNVKYKQWRTQKAIEQEKQSLSQQADSLEKKRTELEQSLSYLNSTSSKERIAREMGLKKEGEVVFNFLDNPVLQNGGNTAALDKNSSNIQKWWNYFVN